MLSNLIFESMRRMSVSESHGMSGMYVHQLDLSLDFEKDARKEGTCCNPDTRDADEKQQAHGSGNLTGPFIRPI